MLKRASSRRWGKTDRTAHGNISSCSTAVRSPSTFRNYPTFLLNIGNSLDKGSGKLRKSIGRMKTRSNSMANSTTRLVSYFSLWPQFRRNLPCESYTAVLLVLNERVYQYDNDWIDIYYYRSFQRLVLQGIADPSTPQRHGRTTRLLLLCTAVLLFVLLVLYINVVPPTACVVVHVSHA